MPVEALENQALDALELELLKIGTAPTSSWLTVTSPAVKVGIPGASVPGPDKMALYLQHIRSERGSDGVGVASHILRSTFAVWCCSSHAADGQRRMLNLVADVRRALIAAEGTFYEKFGYGLSLGSVEFSGNEANLRQGITACALEVVVEMDVALEAVAVEDDLIHPFEFPLPTASGSIRTGPPISPLFGPLTNGARQVIFSRPTGTSGIVRNIAFIIAGTDATGAIAKYPSMTFEIKYDGEPTASVSIPLNTLAGMEYPADSFVDLQVSNQIFEITDSFALSNAPGQITALAFSFRLPIPFTNGIEISAVAANTTDKQVLFCNTAYQDGLPTAWNSNLRFFATRSNEAVPITTPGGAFSMKLVDATHAVATVGSFPANIAGKSIWLTGIANQDVLVVSREDATHITLSAADTVNVPLNVVETDPPYGSVHTFLSRPAGEKGWIAGVIAAFKGTLAFYEGNPRFFLDQSADAQLQWTSVEDMFNGAFFFESAARGQEGGILCSGPDDACIYKNFYKWPIRYVNGVAGKVPNLDDTGIAGVTTVNWTTFYYKEL